MMRMIRADERYPTASAGRRNWTAWSRKFSVGPTYVMGGIQPSQATHARMITIPSQKDGIERPGQAHDPEDVVEPGILADGADHAGRHAQEHRDHDRQAGQLERHRQEGLDELPRRQLVPVGLSEVAGHDLPEPLEVLDPVRAGPSPAP